MAILGAFVKRGIIYRVRVKTRQSERKGPLRASSLKKQGEQTLFRTRFSPIWVPFAAPLGVAFFLEALEALEKLLTHFRGTWDAGRGTGDCLKGCLRRGKAFLVHAEWFGAVILFQNVMVSGRFFYKIVKNHPFGRGCLVLARGMLRNGSA